MHISNYWLVPILFDLKFHISEMCKTCQFCSIQSHTAGGEVAGSPAEVASAVTNLVTMLPESSHVQQVYTGDNGVFR